MRLIGSRRPNVKRLQRNGDVPGLCAAVSYREEEVNYNGIVTDTGIGVRLDALRALMDHEGPQLLEAVRSGLSDEQPAVRFWAVQLASRSEPVAVTDDLVRGLATWPDPPHGEARQAVAAVLADWAPPELPERFATALTSTTENALSEEWDRAWLAAFISADSRDNEQATNAVAERLVERVGDEAGEMSTRTRAAEVLRWLGESGSQPLERALARRDPELIVIELAGDLHDSSLLEALVPLCEHPDPSRRGAAARAVGEIQDTRGVAALLRLTQDEVHTVRQAALTALDRFGVSGVVFGLAAGARQPMLSQLDSRRGTRAVTDGSEHESGSRA